MFYKILQGFVVLDLPQEITPLNTITRGHGRRYQIPFSRIDVHKFSFFLANVKLWNSLPDFTVKLDLGRFRTALMACVVNDYFSPNFYLLLTVLTYTFINKYILYCTCTLLESCNYHNNNNNNNTSDNVTMPCN